MSTTESRKTLCVSRHIVRITQTACQPEEHFQQLPRFIRLPAWFCTRVVAVGSTIAQQAYDALCHMHATLK